VNCEAAGYSHRASVTQQPEARKKKKLSISIPFNNACPEPGEGLRANGKKYLRHVANQGFFLIF
jgi:hypothetical protein